MDNPYGINVNVNPMIVPRSEIPVFANKDEAMAFRMGVDSSVIGFDAKNQVVWILRTDQFGKKTVCEPRVLGDIYVPEPEPDVREMEKKIGSIEEKIDGLITRFGQIEGALK